MFTPSVSDVPTDISDRIQRRERHTHWNDSESQSEAWSAPASQSLTGFTSQSGSESLRSASEYSSSVSGASGMTSDADSPRSSSIDTAKDSGDEVSHELAPESALLATDTSCHTWSSKSPSMADVVHIV